MEHNQLTVFPDSCVNIKTLQSVNFSHNRIKEFPYFLCHMRKLDFVDVSNNSIEALPTEGLENLNVVELNLNRNKIQIVPECLTRCKRLKVLRLEENILELTGLPVSILSQSNVSLLCVDGNLFTKRELEDLPQYEEVCALHCNILESVSYTLQYNSFINSAIVCTYSTSVLPY